MPTLWETHVEHTRTVPVIQRDGTTKMVSMDVWVIPRNDTYKTPEFVFDKKLPRDAIKLFLNGITLPADLDNLVLTKINEHKYNLGPGAKPTFFYDVDAALMADAALGLTSESHKGKYYQTVASQYRLSLSTSGSEFIETALEDPSTEDYNYGASSAIASNYWLNAGSGGARDPLSQGFISGFAALAVTMAHEYGHQNIREAYTVGDGHFEIMEGVATHLGAPDLVANWRDLEWDDVYALQIGFAKRAGYFIPGTGQEKFMKNKAALYTEYEIMKAAGEKNFDIISKGLKLFLRQSRVLGNAGVRVQKEAAVTSETDDGIIFTRSRVDGGNQIDPVTGHYFPSLIFLRDGTARDSAFRSLEVARDEDGNILRTIAQDGFGQDDIRFVHGQRGGVSVVTDFADNKPVATNIKINNNAIAIEFSDFGELLGSQLGYRLAGGDRLSGIVSSALLKTVGDNLGDVLDGVVGRQSVGTAVDDAFATTGSEFLSNLKAAGIGAVSSLLTAELINVLGIDGFAAELFNSGAGAIIGQIASGLAAGTSVSEVFSTLDLAQVGNAIGGFVGAKLASEIISFDTIGGQIGSSIGASLGTIAAIGLLVTGSGSSAALAGVQLGALAGPAGAAIGAFLGFIVGGLIGSLFGGTPRSGADSSWDAERQEFVVANIWSRKGGSQDAAKSIATSVSQTFNAVLAATGGTLLRPALVQAGSYGMEKKDFVYRPSGGGSDHGTITKRFSGQNAATQLVSYGVAKGLSDPDFQIAGGSVYIKRALSSTMHQSADPLTFDITTLFGNIAVAQSYEGYLQNSVTINALIAANPETAMAVETLITLARAQELGLTRRNESDWSGGFSALLREADARSTDVQFGFDFDPQQGQMSRLIKVGQYTLGDTIDIAGQTAIEGTDIADTIDLRSGTLADQRGYTVNGHLNNDIATPDVDFTAVATRTVTFAAAELRKSETVTLVSDTLAEGTEKLVALLANAAGMQIMGGEAVATIVNGTAALPSLIVGDSYAREGDGYAVFRLSLSKATSQAVTVGLALIDGSAAGGGVDYGSAGAANIQVSNDGVTWTSATSLTFAPNALERYVRTAVVSDNGVDGGGQPTNVEGNQRFTLQVTPTTGAAGLANGAAAVTGTGTIVDGSSSEPLVWIDDIIVDEVSGQAKFTISRSRTMTGASTVTFATGDRSALAIDVAATVDAGAGNDLIYASDLGDNLFGSAGNDTLLGGRLDDWLIGGDGNDSLDAGRPETMGGLLGGDGNYLAGGEGNDTLRGREGSDWLEGGAGTDSVTGGDGDDVLAGGAGDGDMLKGGIGADQYIVRRGDGLDVIEDEGGNVPVPGSGSGDAITQRMAAIELWKANPAASGAIRPNWLGTAPGVDQGTISGGDDAILFSEDINIGDIRLQRSNADLIVTIMTTVDGVESASGTALTLKDWFTNPFKRVEWLKFADGNEIRIGDITSFIVGGSGNDVLVGTAGNDFVYGGAGNDRMYLLGGDDVGNGGTGDDMVSGDAGRDLVIGGQGNDNLFGGGDSDAISGDGGADRIYGGAARDILSGGRGDGDEVVGGAGDDTFKYARGDGRDIFFDEYANYWQVVWTPASEWNTAAGYSYNNVTGEVLGPGGTIIYKNVGTLQSPDFQWIGRFDFDSVSQTLRYFNAPVGAAIAVNSGVDTIELAPGINLQDVILRRPTGTNDLILAISQENEELGDTSKVADSITIKDWFASPGQIEKLAFYQTGVLDIAPAKTTLILGTDGADGTTAVALQGTSGADWATGAAGDDVIAGGQGNDTIAGNSGFDILRGEIGNDVLYGGAGNDQLDGGAGADILVGGAGQDMASYASSSGAERVHLSASWANAGNAAGDEYSSIENVTGGSGADYLGGDLAGNELTGGLGDDTLEGNGGDDVYLWNVGDGADTVTDQRFVVEEVVTTAGVLAAGYTTSWGRTGTIEAATGNHYWRLAITGPDGSLVYENATYSYAPAVNAPLPTPQSYVQAGWLGGFKRTNNQQVTRQRYDGTIDGGNDLIEFGRNISLNDLTFIKNGANLTIRYGGSTTAQVTIVGQTSANSAIETLVLNDGFAVSLANIQIATSGSQLVGSSGDDLIAGQAGALADNLSGGDGNDVLVGYAGNDQLYGGNGDDVFEGGLGADTMDGGANSASGAGPNAGDTARYVRSTAGVSVNLALTTAQAGTGDSVGDILLGIENVVGSAFADVLSGDAADNRLFGLDGNDTLTGAGGNDVLVGEAGNDSIGGDAGEDNLSGGAGSDTLSGGSEDDAVDGGEGDDALSGNAGADNLLGGAGLDVMDGGDGNDTLGGGLDNDQLLGGLGNDLLSGDEGNDSLRGGAGDDDYLFGALSGSDTVLDTEGTNDLLFDETVSFDRIWMTRVGNDLRVAVIGGDTVITVSAFFATSDQARIRAIYTTTHALFLNHPDTQTLLSAMTNATGTPGVTPQILPQMIDPLLGSYWHSGGKAAPTAPVTPRGVVLVEDVGVNIDGNYGVIDHDQNLVGYSLKADAGPTKGTISNLNPTTGAFTYTPFPDVNGTDTLTLVATDADGHSVLVPIALTITPVNDAPRGLAVKNGANLVIAESTPRAVVQAGTLIGEFVATDPEGDLLTYSLVTNPGSRFAISADGKLSIALPTAIDFEAAPSHTIRVKVADPSGAFLEQDFVVTVTNANEPNALPSSYAPTVAENSALGSVVGSVAATDLDASGAFASQRYYFLNGTTASATSSDGRYAINATTGQITTNAALNYETAPAPVVYQVIARDNAGAAGYYQAQSAVSIGITDVNEANSFAAIAPMAVNENVAVGTIVGSVAATDLDGAGTVNAQQRYYFLNGATASAISSDGRYTISATTGQITTSVALNYEAGSVSAVYQIIARDRAAGAGYLQAQAAVTIALNDVNEANSFPAIAPMAVNENVAVGTVLGSVAATDIDGAGTTNAQQRYYFWDGTTATATSSDGRYAINATTGQITVNAALNFEAGAPSKVYQVIARDKAGAAGYFQAQAAVTIGINDLNEAPTSLNWTPSVASVAERDRVAAGTSRPAIALGTVSVTDPDTAGLASATYSYAVSDTRFEIISGGTLRLKQDAVFDFEAGATVTVTVTGTDGTGTPFTINRAIVITVTDQDDILEGGTGNDTLSGQQGRDIISGFVGNDVINGLAGNDMLDGGDGADQINGGDGNDSLLGQVGADTLSGGIGADTLRGGADNDRLLGEDGNDLLYGEAGAEGSRAGGTEAWRGFTQAGLVGGAGDDLLDGGDGDDYLDGGAGADQLIGGLGFDGVDYSGSNAAVVVNLTTGTGTGGWAQGDTLSGFELVQGSGYADSLTGTAGSDILYGGAGNDLILGGAGNDYLFGGDGDDTINAEAGDDMLDGGVGNDVLNGGIDNDVYVVTRSSGADIINNYDPSGDDIDVIGFNDVLGTIYDQDLWFERIANDLKITVIGTGSSVQVVNWYTVTDAASRANHKIDFIVANIASSRTLNIEALVTLMASKTKPTTAAQRDTLMTDLTYKAAWATHWNMNAAPAMVAIAQQTTNEDAAKAVTVTATDDITPNAQIQMSAQVISGTNVVTSAGITFGAANAAGVRTMTINPVANAAGTARIRITATDAGGVFSTQEFDIVVNAVADTPTVTQLTSAGGTAGQAGGIALSVNASFPDADGSEVQQIWITGVPAGVTLSAGTYDSGTATWRLTPAQLAGLKINAPAGWSQDLSLTATARATENGQTAVSAPMVAVVAINAPPTDATFSGSVNEHAANGTPIANVVGVDPDAGDVLAYSLTDTAGGRFAISAAGAVSVGNGTLLNFETLTSHSITVRITDSRGQFIDRSFSIAVNNVNEANAIQAAYNFAIDENSGAGATAGTVVASDIDSSAVAFGQQRYYFWNGTTAQATSFDGRYTINATTGVITSNAVFNFEAEPASTLHRVIARDNAGNAGYNQVETQVTITLNNLNEQNWLPATSSNSVAELDPIGTWVTTIVASDPDGGVFGSQRYYFWDGAALGSISYDGRYQINTTTGAITTNAVLDFEAGSPSRAYTIIARDNQGAAGFTQAQSTATLSIVNVNEAPNKPNNGATVWSFFDETGLGANPANSYVGVASFPMSDPDGTTPQLRFASGGNPNGWFYIDGNVVRLNAGLDFNFEWARNAGYGIHDWNGDGRLDAHMANVYVEAWDGALASSAVPEPTLFQFFISNVNERPNNLIVEAANLFSETFGSQSHASQLIARFTMADPDGETPQVVITGGNPHGWFTTSGGNHLAFAGANFTADWLRGNKGQWGIDADYYYDTDGDGLREIRVATLTLAAQDASGVRSDNFTYNVYIEDVNEAPGWNANPFTMNIIENPSWYQHIGWVSGSDIDGPAGELRYVFSNWDRYYDSALSQWVSRTADHKFVMTENGEIRVNGTQAIDYDFGTRTFSYSTLVYDKAFGANNAYSWGTLNINVQDFNEQHVLGYRDVLINEVYTGGPLVPLTDLYSGQTIDLNAMLLNDPDQRPWTMNWSFLDGSLDNGYWHLTPQGLLTLRYGSIDYETLAGQGAVNTLLNVQANDGQYNAAGQINVAVRDVDEAPWISTSGLYIYNYQMWDPYTGNPLGMTYETYFNYYIGDPDSTPGYAAPYTITYANTHGYGGWPGYFNWNYNMSAVWSVPDSWGYPGYQAWTSDTVYGNSGQFLVYGMYPHLLTTLYATDAGGQTGALNVDLRAPGYNVPPIVLDLDGDGIELTGWQAQSVRFDMNGDGLRDLTGWVGADDGLLAIDLNGNGLVDDSTEIAFQPKLEGAISDLEGLRAYDSNDDGFINAGDARFGDFRVWQDLNQNGVSEAGELRTLDEAGILAINLTLSPTGDVPQDDALENVVYGHSEFIRADGSRGEVGDVFLNYIAEGEANMIIGRHHNVVAIDLAGDGVSIGGLADSDVSFDMLGSGAQIATAWIGAQDAMLVADLDGNGLVDGGAELGLGTAGFSTDALRKLDSNRDGRIDVGDERFQTLRLWRDANQDGISQIGELTSLDAAGIAALHIPREADPFSLGTGESKAYTAFTVDYNNGTTKQGAQVLLAHADLIASQAGLLAQAMSAHVTSSGTDGQSSTLPPTNDPYQLVSSAA